MKQLESEIIDFSELADMIDMPIKYYSSGMLSRLAFSIGAIVDPEILLLDEIFAAGDAHFVQKSIDRLRQIFNKSQIVMLVAHDLSQIAELCNQCIVLHKGQIMKIDEPRHAIYYYMKEIVQADEQARLIYAV
jgi:ABC-type polysaccharide/polyol phosphate transport system ATPase subunit